MEAFTDPFVDGWKPEDVLWEVALKEGLSLSSRVAALDLDSNRVWRVIDEATDQTFLICLDDKVQAVTAEALGLGLDDLFVCRDVALTDELAANLALQCRLKTI